MANNIISIPDDFWLSSQFPDLTVRIGIPSRVELRIDGETVFGQTYYPDDGGSFVLSDMASIINGYMERHKTALSKVEVAVELAGGGEESVSAWVLYCSCDIEEGEEDAPLYETFLPANYLMASSVRVVPKNLTTDIFFLAVPAEQGSTRFFVTYSVDGREPETSELEGMERAYAAQDDPVIVRVPVDIARIKESVRDSLSEGQEPRIHAVYLRSGDRRASLFVSEQPLPEEFTFRNMFGVLDRLHLAPATTEKREIKNSIAILGKLRKAYDRQVEQNFEAVAANLDRHQVEVLMDMLASAEIYKAGREIIITDASPELSTGVNGLNDVKFTYRYTRYTPMRAGERTGRIFREQYDTTFK